MCGLAGALSRYLSKFEVETFKSIMAVHTLRGPYGSGVCGVPQKERHPPHVVRNRGTAAALIFNPENKFDEAYKGNHTLFMGHCRMPTSGSWDIEDTHPIIADHIIGVHNGTLGVVNGQKVEKTDLDSRLLFKSFASVGAEATLRASKGAYAIVWVDTKESTLNFARNENRPLWFGSWDDEKSLSTLYWGSEFGLLWAAMSRLKEKPHLFACPTEEILSFQMRPRQFPIRPQRTSLKAPVGPVAPAPVTTVPRIAANDGAFIETIRNCWLTTSQYLTHLRQGCVVCGMPPEDHKKEKIFWVGRTEYVCDSPECYTDGIFRTLYPDGEVEIQRQRRQQSQSN